MKRFIWVTCLLLLFSLYACSNDAGNMESSYDQSADTAVGDAGFEQSSSDGEKSREEENGSAEPNPDSKNSNQMIIRTGYIDIVVKDYKATIDQIKQEINKFNGYIVQSSQYNQSEDGNLSGEMKVRVPQEHFDAFMSSLESDDAKIQRKTQESKDVTEEYVDLESRLKAQEAVEERLLSFMERANRTEDLLKISEDLSKVQQEIEQIKGRMKYLENHVSYSTVTISIEERKVNVPEVQSTSELNTLANAQKLFMETINFILKIGSGFVVFFIGLSPILIPLVVIGIFILLKFRKKNKPE